MSFKRMRFKRYEKGSIVATNDGSGNMVLSTAHGGGLLRGTQIVVERADFDDLSDIMRCIATDAGETRCRWAGVKVTP